jgi:hypothetical protein
MRDKKVRPLYLFFFFFGNKFFRFFPVRTLFSFTSMYRKSFFFFMHEQSRDSDINSAKLK